ncbi:hypothetical protein V8C35DRAFT_307914 [Trichoderma chlorosporum]
MPVKSQSGRGPATSDSHFAGASAKDVGSTQLVSLLGVAQQILWQWLVSFTLDTTVKSGVCKALCSPQCLRQLRPEHPWLGKTTIPWPWQPQHSAHIAAGLSDMLPAGAYLTASIRSRCVCAPGMRVITH